MNTKAIITVLNKYAIHNYNDVKTIWASDIDKIAKELSLLQEQGEECEHPYALVYRKGDYEKCTKCGKVLCEG